MLVSLAAVAVSFVAISALTAHAAAAQTWSPQEQEAIAHLRACWETWATEDYDTWIQTCNLDRSGSYWSSDELAPNSMETREGYLRSIVLEGFENGDVVAWDVRPIKVTTWGDVVGVYFYGIVHLKDSDGNVSVVQDRRFEVLRKTNGRWGVVGGMAVLGSEEQG
jgi:hypothetical protein